MELPDFELGPLELEEVADSEPAIAPASARVKVGEDWYLLRECPQEDLIGTVVFLRVDAPCSPVLKAIFWPKEQSLQRDLEKPEEIFQAWEWNRVFDFDETLSGLRLQIFKERAQWVFKNDIEVAEWKFSDEIPFSWLIYAPDEEVRGRVLSLLQDAHSDCSFALRWGALSTEDQSIFATCLGQSSWDEFEAVLLWLAWNNFWFICDEETSWGVWIELADDADVIEWDEKNICLFYALLISAPEEVELPEPVEKILRIIHSYFRPAYNHNLRPYTALQEFLKHDCFRYDVEVSTPTSHERLEARLRLREWLFDKVAAEEIPALLGDA